MLGGLACELVLALVGAVESFLVGGVVLRFCESGLQFVVQFRHLSPSGATNFDPQTSASNFQAGGTSRSPPTTSKNSTDPKVPDDPIVTYIHRPGNFIRHFKEGGIYNSKPRDTLFLDWNKVHHTPAERKLVFGLNHD